MIAVGSGNPDVAPAILQVIMDRTSSGDTKDAFVKFLPLSLGLIYLGRCTRGGGGGAVDVGTTKYLVVVVARRMLFCEEMGVYSEM